MLLDASSFAVIGASNKKGKVGNVIFRNLINSKKKVYPVNPYHKKILSHKCYRSIKELKDKVSHAIIAVPAKIVSEVIKDCVYARVKVAIIISAGFSESGNKNLEEEVINIAKKGNLRILGPNVLGIIVPDNYNASFFEDELKTGNITFISQSGALGVGILDFLISINKGLRAFISVGNTADLTITEVLNEVVNDKKTKSIIIYAESLKNGTEFIKTCKKTDKPIFILKAGDSKAGRKASKTHTGSLTGNKEIYSAAFKQCGVRQVNSIKDLVNSALIYGYAGYLGKKALIITNAGGPGILMTDALSKDFSIVKLPLSVVNEINEKLKKVAWSKANPIDIVGDADAQRYKIVLDVLKDKDFYDFVIVLLTPQAMTEPFKTAKEVVNFYKKTKKPIFGCFIGGNKIKKAVKLMSLKIPVFDNIMDLAMSIRNLKH